MALLHMHTQPDMTRHVVEKRLFVDEPVIVVDVGARGGYDEAWDAFGDQLAVIGFEPEPAECERLNTNAPPHVAYLPYALGAREETREFYVAAFSGSSGLCSGGTEFIQRFFEGDNLKTVRTESIQVYPLDSVLAQRGIGPVNFIKLDCEGADLEVLQGAERILHQPQTLGVLVEVWFQKESRRCGYTFVDIHEHLTERGFFLFDMDSYRYNRRAMPFPFVSDIRDEAGRLIPGQTTHGQIIRGDALYFRDFIQNPLQTPRDENALLLLKLACFYEIWGLQDCAAELLLHYKSDLSALVDTEQLLDLLTPELGGIKLSYREYVQWTQSNPLSLRPSLSSVPDVLKRGAEVILRFEGKPGAILRHGLRWLARRGKK